MVNKIVMPKLGETMNEGTILRWIKKEGETVEKGDPLFEVMTDKVNIEVESFVKGTLRKILIPEGEVVPVLTPIALIGEPSEPLPDLSEYSLPAEKEELEIKEKEVKAEKVAVVPSGERITISPRARRLAQEKGVDFTLVAGTGPDGRITEKDVLDFLTTRAPKEEKKIPGQIIPVSPARKVIARRMVESKTTIPHFYLNVEIDMTEAVKLRGSLPEKLRKEQVPSYHDLVIKAVATALAEFPQINVRFLEDKIQVLPEINIGLAVAITEGLIVPVVKQANRKSLIEIAKETQDLISRARENKLKREEVGNASLTITNLGMYGVDSFAAIINPPETTILALGRIAPRPWVVNGVIAVRSMMTATLSCDHRVIDGVIGGQFLQRFRTILENPHLLL